MPSSVAVDTARDLQELSRAGLQFDDFAVQASDLLRRAVPFDGLCIGIVDPCTNLLTRSLKVDLGPVSDRTFLYWEYAEEDVAHFRELATRSIGVAVLDEETHGDKNASGRFREVVSTDINADHELRGVTRVGGLMWGTYAMYRGVGAAPFNAAEADYLQRLETTLATGIRASTIVGVAASASVADSTTGPAVLVFSDSGAIVHATSTAAERLDDLGGTIEGELPVPVSAIVSAVQGARSAGEAIRSLQRAAVPGDPATIAEVWPASLTDGPIASAQIRARGRSGRWYSLHAAPFAASGASVAGGAGRPNIAVTVEPATPPQILPLLVAAYGLTEREATIVQAMLRGESTHAIAQSLFLSPYTVQDHFKSIFDKIGVSSRREVATRVFYGQYLPAHVA